MPDAPAAKPYVVFARRWRPQTFDEVVGQDHISQQLKNAVASGRVGHAFLFRGPRGVGKTSMARILAKALNCVKGPTPEPCGTCVHCRNIAAGNAMDVIEIDAATHTQVDEMRSILGTVGYAPAAMRFKIYIVDEVHMLSRHAFNALLKTLEEPPAQVKFIFATTDPQKIPETIRSRCQDFEFRRISTDDIVRRLDHILAHEPGVEVDPAERPAILEALARHAEGGMRDAQVALDQLIALTSGHLSLEATHRLLGSIENRLLIDTVRALQGNDTGRLLEIVDSLVESGADLEAFVKALTQFTRDLLVLKTAPQHEPLTDIPSTWLGEVRALLPTLSLALLLNLGSNLIELAEQIKTASHTRFLIEFFFIKLTSVGSTRSIETLLQGLASGQPLAPSGAGAARQSAASAPASAMADPLAAPPGPVAKVLRRVADPADAASLWRELTSLLWGQDMRMRNYLEHGQPLSAEGQVFRIGVSDKFTFERLVRDPAHAQKIADLLAQLTGQPWRVRFERAGATDPPAPEAPSGETAQGPVEEPRVPPPARPSEPPVPRASDLLSRSPFLRHLQERFQCTGLSLVRRPTESHP